MDRNQSIVVDNEEVVVKKSVVGNGKVGVKTLRSDKVHSKESTKEKEHRSSERDKKNQGVLPESKIDSGTVDVKKDVANAGRHSTLLIWGDDDISDLGIHGKYLGARGKCMMSCEIMSWIWNLRIQSGGEAILMTRINITMIAEMLKRVNRQGMIGPGVQVTRMKSNKIIGIEKVFMMICARTSRR
ncbi:hypothetical protein C5167_006232 [Papaver somniferum]|uniref:Uncharacterized protein n=1 Tax=Papaver somniferum TaxID=3469 RepID=A0A4Y7JGJ4_PAPSO|nr:hypothetical protein C5167_006232 [Papaver somniferum]